eukprot:97470-Chlamydomonas_euryale.AAC.2
MTPMRCPCWKRALLGHGAHPVVSHPVPSHPAPSHQDRLHGDHGDRGSQPDTRVRARAEGSRPDLGVAVWTCEQIQSQSRRNKTRLGCGRVIQKPALLTS